ncbi:hypothetical protein YB2330_001539 [Saitoella coloradoensis]
MADFWKSTPKYYCKFCEAYVTDTKLGRQQHEATGKHQGNLKRNLRELHKKAEEKKREDKIVQQELKRIEKITGAAQTKEDEKDDAKGEKGGFYESSATTSKSAQPISTVKKIKDDTPKTLDSEIFKATTAVINPNAPPPSSYVPERPPPKRDSTNAKPDLTDEYVKAELAYARKREIDEEEATGQSKDPEDLRKFKVEEKTYPIDDLPGDEGNIPAPTFKKRKTGGAGRNVRKKD